jgi:FkbM family methyltransferase
MENNPRLNGRRILLYLGGSDGYGIMNIITENHYHTFTEIHVFEAQKESYDKLVNQLKQFQNVFVNYGAVVNKPVKSEETVDFYIFNQNGSSSLGSTLDEKWPNYGMTNNKRQVPAINIYQYCQQHNITDIDTYISDLQGIDLEVLKTLKPLIDSKKIRQIQCEVTINGKRNIYKDLPSNELSEFESLLRANYNKKSIGWTSGLLAPELNCIMPENWWEADILWIRKD